MTDTNESADAVARKPKRAPRVRDAVTFVRSSHAWKSHVEHLAELDGAQTISEFIDRAVLHYARSRGMAPPPKR